MLDIFDNPKNIVRLSKNLLTKKIFSPKPGVFFTPRKKMRFSKNFVHP